MSDAAPGLCSTLAVTHLACLLPATWLLWTLSSPHVSGNSPLNLDKDIKFLDSYYWNLTFYMKDHASECWVLGPAGTILKPLSCSFPYCIINLNLPLVYLLFFAVPGTVSSPTELSRMYPTPPSLEHQNNYNDQGSVQGMGQTDHNNSGDFGDFIVDQAMMSPKPEPIEVSKCPQVNNARALGIQVWATPTPQNIFGQQKILASNQ